MPSKDEEFSVVATAMMILVAGYDTTGTTMAHAAYRLALNPDVQDKLFAEIDEKVQEANGGDLDYTTLQNMPYLDQVLHETLRLHPPAPFLFRSCTKDYVIPGTNVTIEKGQDLQINTIGIQLDENYYENPTKFNPDNFSKEARTGRSPYTFLAFGQGPRSCVGMRFAMLEAKVGIVTVLRRFKLLATEETPKVLHRDPTQLLGIPIEKMLIKFEERH